MVGGGGGGGGQDGLFIQFALYILPLGLSLKCQILSRVGSQPPGPLGVAKKMRRRLICWGRFTDYAMQCKALQSCSCILSNTVVACFQCSLHLHHGSSE